MVGSVRLRLPEPAREALASLAHESEFCFVNSQRKHWTTTSRAYWWNQVRRDVGYDGSLYLATRHHAGWFMVNVLGLSAAEVAIALGHEDGGKLIESLYGHRDRRRTLERVVAAYDGRANVVPLLRAGGGSMRRSLALAMLDPKWLLSSLGRFGLLLDRWLRPVDNSDSRALDPFDVRGLG